MRDYSVVLQAAYDPLNVHSDVGYAPRVGGVFFGQGKASSGESWQDELDVQTEDLGQPSPHHLDADTPETLSWL